MRGTQNVDWQVVRKVCTGVVMRVTAPGLRIPSGHAYSLRAGAGRGAQREQCEP